MPDVNEPILARLAPGIALGDPSALPEEIMVFPAGTHTINASQSGRPITKKVTIGPDTAAAMQTALAAHLTAGEQKPYFDFDHDDTKASAWPKSYRWEPGTGGKKPGVYAAVDWTASGSAAVLGKDYRSFSPAFLVYEATPARVTGAPLNMGGLVNAPAFRAQAPIWAKQEPSAATPNDPQSTMTEEEKKAEAAKKAAEAKEAEAIQAKETVTALKTKVEALEAKETARKKSDAAARVAAAVKRGALPAKDEAIQAKWRGLIEADDANVALLDALPDSPLLQGVTAPGGQIEAKIGLIDALRAYGAEKDAIKRGVIYAKDVSPLFKPGFALGPILAANSLGTLTSDLLTQRSLSLLKLSYPWLFSISTDFSSEGADFGQTVKTRLKGALVANDYDPATGYGSNNASTTDVSVTINQHKGVPVSFNANELGSTKRDLFGEQSEGMHYALGTAFVDYVLALITAGNFANHTDSKLSLFNRSVMRAAAKAMGLRKVPAMGRIALLNPDFFEAAGNDTTILQMAAFSRNELITEYSLPRMAGFQPFEAVSLPTANALAGFFCTPEALAFATRVPSDYTQALPGASNGAVSVVRNADTGISVQLVQYVDHNLAAATARVAVMFGAAKGNGACGQRLLQTAEA